MKPPLAHYPFHGMKFPVDREIVMDFNTLFRLQLSDSVIQGWHSTSNTSVSFSDLNACTLYHFEVRAVNNNGSDKSSRMSVSTGVISKLI